MIQLPYSLQVVQPLKVLFLQDEFKQIPEIRFKPNSDLSLITSNVASLAITSSPVDDQAKQVSDIFDAISEYMQDSKNLLRIETLEHTSKAFATILETSYATLNETISSTVDRIRTDISSRYAELMTREKAETLITETYVEPSESDYMQVNWGNLTSPMRQNEVIESACLNANLNNTALSTLNFSYISGKMNYSAGFKSVDIPTEVAEKIIEKISTIVVTDNSNITSDMLRSAWLIFTNKEAYNRFCSDTSVKFNDVRNITMNCIDFIATVNAVSTVGELISRIASEDLGPETLSNLAANTELVNKTVCAIQYWLLLAKEVRFANKLILTPTVLNGPVYSDYVQGGGSIVNVHNYLKAFHLDTTVPLDGISVSTIRDTDVKDRLEKSASKLKSNAVFIKSKCLIAAYEHAVRNFIVSEDLAVMFPHVKDPSFVTRFMHVAIHKASFLGGNIANIDKVLYELIISTFYADTLVATMYKYLGTSFDNLADTANDEITDERIIEAQCDGVTELLVDYLFNTVVEKSSIVNRATA